MSAKKQNRLVTLVILLGSLLPSFASAQFERDPEVEKAYQAGVAAMEAKEWEAAIAEFDKALVDTTYAEAHLGRADALREIEDYQNAIKGYQAAVQINPNLAQAYNGRGICYRELGDANLLGLALNDFQNAVELDRKDPEIAANLGDILVNNAQDPTQAMQYLDRAIEFNPENAEAYRNRGWAHTLLREFEEGIADLKKAIELDAEDYETYQRLANVHLAEEDYQKGIDAISKAIEYYKPKDNSEPNTYITGYLQRTTASLTLAKQADQAPEQRKALYTKVVADADAILKEFPDRFPQSGLALYQRGTALRMQGLFAEAITDLTDAIQLIPTGQDSNYVGDAYRLRGICWFYQGQISLARGDFREAASQSLEDPLPYLWTGYCHAEEGDYRKAIESYGNATAKQPGFALPYVNRGLAYMKLEEYSKAIENFNEAIRVEPTEPKHFYKRGLAHEQLDEAQKALDSYQLALLRDGQFDEANQGAARALKALGRPELGRQYENRQYENRMPAGSGSR